MFLAIAVAVGAIKSSNWNHTRHVRTYVRKGISPSVLAAEKWHMDLIWKVYTLQMNRSI